MWGKHPEHGARRWVRREHRAQMLPDTRVIPLDANARRYVDGGFATLVCCGRGRAMDSSSPIRHRRSTIRDRLRALFSLGFNDYFHGSTAQASYVGLHG